MALAAAVSMALVAVFGPMLMGDRAVELDVEAARQGMSRDHWFGTDGLGRDVLARVVVATRLSLRLAVVATLIGTVVGVTLGALPVVLGRRLGRFVTAVINFAVAMPGLLLALFLAAILGVGARGATIAIGLAYAPDFARLTSNLSTSVAGLDFVAAARVQGVGRSRLLARHVLPNIAEPLVISATVAIGGALLTFSGLSFLGLGVQPPDYDWGRMLDEGLDRIYINPAGSLAPGIAIILAGLSFNLIGDAVARGLGHRDLTRARGRVRSPRRDDRRDGVRAASSVDRATGSEPVLQVENLRVTLGRGQATTRLVDGVSFDVRPHETIGLVGESGSGKSLTAMAIAQLIEHPLAAEADVLEFLGRDLARLPDRELRDLLGRSMAIVFQDPSSAFNPTMRVGRQLAEVAETHLDTDRKEASSIAVDRLRSVRVAAPEYRARQYPHELSGGMRQRAMLGMAIMGSPQLLIADEPTTGLDVTIQAQILDLLEHVQADSGAALLFVSHDIALIAGFCDRVLVMYSGSVVEDLSVAQLLDGPGHPYTEALLATVPDVSTDRDAPLATIPGRPMEPHLRPDGCAFTPRCRYANDRCRTERPVIHEVGDAHRVACWHPVEAPTRRPDHATEDARR